MFAVIYRSYLKPGKEVVYREAWDIVASYFIEYCGALGSTLHKTDDNLWVAYSRWPSKAVRDAAWPGQNATNQILPTNIAATIATIKDCLVPENKLPDIEMEVIDDKLLGKM
jgi:hypothetical protein